MRQMRQTKPAVWTDTLARLLDEHLLTLKYFIVGNNPHVGFTRLSLLKLLNLAITKSPDEYGEFRESETVS